MQKVIRETSNAGIWVHGSFIVNLPNEEDCEFKETIDFINRNKEYLDSVDISIFSLNQGSYVSLNPEDYGIDKIKPTIGAGLGMSYSTKTKDIDAVYSVGFNRLVELRNVRFQNKISKIIDPADIFKAFSKFNGKEEAKKYLKQEKKYPKLI
jgi:endonuclease IV